MFCFYLFHNYQRKGRFRAAFSLFSAAEKTAYSALFEKNQKFLKKIMIFVSTFSHSVCFNHRVHTKQRNKFAAYYKANVLVCYSALN